MKTIEAAEFKEQSLALLDQLDAEGLVVTRNSKRVALVLPYDQDCANLIGSLKNRIEIRGEILTTGLRRNAAIQS